ncbi:MAG TPA: hypothetical protein PL048_19010, partial [Leptospiraceae bacterium]|nr:hypothetical protein [Leptospiraceae bacterium]
IVEKWCPLTWESFVKHRVNAVILSQSDVRAMQEYCRGDIETLDELDKHFSGKGEFAEFKNKLETMRLGRDFL